MEGGLGIYAGLAYDAMRCYNRWEINLDQNPSGSSAIAILTHEIYPAFKGETLGSSRGLSFVLGFTHCHNEDDHRYYDGDGNINVKSSPLWHSIQCGHDRARTHRIIASNSKGHPHIGDADTAR